MSNVIKIAPSILSADFAQLGEQVREAEQAGADRIHVDVMDGHFVPNISMGAPIVESLRRVTRLPLETHLMISDPDFFLDEFTQAGSNSFLVHWEGNNNLHRTVQRVKALGKCVGVVINPATPAAVLEEILRCGSGVSHDCQPGLWTPAFHPHDVAKDSPRPPDDR
jgi:ribulose-phosphate 3-epimerase